MTDRTPNTIEDLESTLLCMRSTIDVLQRALRGVEIALARDKDVAGAMKFITTNREYIDADWYAAHGERGASKTCTCQQAGITPCAQFPDCRR